ncbi:General negative regulator of transcription subunit 1 [Dictyocoela roeselum]|nr:General negative regulator of transcription subunit 1 [Dictyocoela roeselum]
MQPRDDNNENLKRKIFELGRENTTKANIKDIINTLTSKIEVGEIEIASLLIFLITEDTWPIAPILEAIKENIATVNWIKIYELMDTPELKIENISNYYRIIGIWRCINGENTFPFKIFFSTWKNRDAQIKFIGFLIQSDALTTNIFNNIFTTRIMTHEEARNLKIKPESNYNCLELFKTIRDLELTSFIEEMQKSSLEYTLLGLTYVHPFCSDIHERLLKIACIENKPIVGTVFKKNQKLILLKFENICCGVNKNGENNQNVSKNAEIEQSTILQNPDSLVNENSPNSSVLGKINDNELTLTRILDIALEQKLLPIISDLATPSFFCFELIVLSSRRDHLNLNVWINNGYNKKKENFIISLINYMIQKFNRHSTYRREILKHGDASLTVNTSTDFSLSNPFDTYYFPLTQEIACTVINILEHKSGTFSNETKSLFQKLKQNLPNYIKDMNTAKASIGAENNDFITDLISGNRSVSESISILTALVSGGAHERDMAMNMFNFLIENYSNLCVINEKQGSVSNEFKARSRLASLYGQLVQRKIFPSNYLTRALNTILKSLKSSDEHEFNFAIKCLDEFIENIFEFPDFYKEIEKIETVKILLRKRKHTYLLEDDNVPFVRFDLLFTTNMDSSNENRLHLHENIPSEDPYRNFVVQNNFTLTNENFTHLYQKFSEKIRLNQVNPEHLAKFFLENKIFDSSTHQIYIRFFLNIYDQFFHFLNAEIFRILKSLLVVKIDKNQEIQYAKILGEFSGKLNLSRDKYFNHDEFDVQDFFIAAINQKRISIPILFFTHFIRQSKSSTVIRPNNPFIMGIVSILFELYDYVSTGLKNEIENMTIELNLLGKNPNPTKNEGFYRSIIKDGHRKFRDFRTNEKIIGSLKQISATGSKLSYLAVYKIEHKNISKHVISMAIDFSIREIGFVLASRAMKIGLKASQGIFKNIVHGRSLQTENDIVSKGAGSHEVQHNSYMDVLNPKTKSEELNHEILTNPVAQFKNLFSNLIKALIKATSLEPLRACICENMTLFLKMSGLELPMEEVFKITNDNLKICTDLIENIALTEAIYANDKHAGVSDHLKIYEQIGDDVCSDNFNSAPSVTDETMATLDVESPFMLPIINKGIRFDVIKTSTTKQREYNEIKEKLSKFKKDATHTTEQAWLDLKELLNSIVNELSNTQLMADEDKYERNIQADSLVVKCVLKIDEIIQNSDRNIDQVCELLCQKIAAYIINNSRNCEGCKVCFEILSPKKMLQNEGNSYDINQEINENLRDLSLQEPATYEEKSSDNSRTALNLPPIVLEILVYFLKRTFSLSQKTQYELTKWVIYSSPEQTNSIQLLKILLKHRLIHIFELDAYLSRAEYSENHISFMLNLITHLIFEFICSPYELVSSIEYLNKINKERVDFRIYNLLCKIQEIVMDEQTITLSKENHSSKSESIITPAEKANSNIKSIVSKIKTEADKGNTFRNDVWALACDHYIKYLHVPSNYQFIEADKINDTLIHSLEIFYNHIKRQDYVFMNIYYRFLENMFTNIMEISKNFKENSDILNLITILSPKNIPCFIILFLKLCRHPLIVDLIFIPKNKNNHSGPIINELKSFYPNYKIRDYYLVGFHVCIEILSVLDFLEDRHSVILNEIYQFFKSLETSGFLKENAHHFSFIVDRKFMILKNLFNKIQTGEKCEIDFRTDRSAYYSMYTYLNSLEEREKFREKFKSAGISLKSEDVDVFKDNPDDFVLSALIDHCKIEIGRKIVRDLALRNNDVLSELIYRVFAGEGEIYLGILDEIGIDYEFMNSIKKIQNRVEVINQQ